MLSLHWFIWWIVSVEKSWIIFFFSPLIWKAFIPRALGFLQESSAPVRQPSKGLQTDTWRFMHTHWDIAVAPCLMCLCLCLWKSSQSNLTKEPIAAPSSSPQSVLQLHQEKRQSNAQKKRNCFEPSWDSQKWTWGGVSWKHKTGRGGWR